MTSHLPPLVQATAGSLGAVVSGALVFPADTLVKRNQVKRPARRRPTERAYEATRLGRPVKAVYPHPTGFRAVVHTLKTEGLLSLYSGLGPDSLSTLLSQFLYFLCYTALRTRLVKRKQRFQQPQAAAVDTKSAKKAAAILLSPLEELGIGCLAGVVAKGLVSPLSMITVRAQTSRQPRQDVVGGKPGDKSPVDPAAAATATTAEKQPDDSDSDESDDGYSAAPSTIDLAREIYDEQGLAGFWSGFSSTVILVRTA